MGDLVAVVRSAAMSGSGPAVFRDALGSTGLFDRERLEFLINSSRAAINLVTEDGRQLDASSEEVRSGLRRGMTLELDHAQFFSVDLASMANQMSSQLGNEWIDVSVLYSPDPLRSPFPVHHDEFDTVAVQIEGERRWTFYDPVVEFPIAGFPQVDYESACLQQVLDVTLEPGDALWFRRGDPHRVSGSGSGASLHVDFLIRRVRRLNVVDWLARQLVSDARFREPWPWSPEPTEDTSIRELWFQETMDLLRDAAASLPRAEFASFLAEMSERRPDSRWLSVRDPEPAKLTDVVEIAIPEQTLSARNGKLVVASNETDLSAVPAMLILSVLKTEGASRVADLRRSRSPDADELEIVRSLVGWRVLRVVAPEERS